MLCRLVKMQDKYPVHSFLGGLKNFLPNDVVLGMNSTEMYLSFVLLRLET